MRRSKEAGIRPTRPEADRRRKPREIVSRGGKPHVVVPLDEFERLTIADDIRTAVATLSDPSTQWTDVDEAIAQRAAPKIAAHRKQRGWTQEMLAAKLGMPQSQISRMEKNPEAMTYRTLKRVAKALGVEVSALL